MALTYGQVKWKAILAMVDRGDAGPEPDITPVAGFVTFKPSIDVQYDTESVPPQTVLLLPIRAGIDENGVLRDGDGNDSVTLIANNSPGLSHTGWTYEATFQLNDAPDVGPFPFLLPSGTTVDLSEEAPVAISRGVAIIRGPKGPKGDTGLKGDTGPAGVNGSGAVNSVNGQVGAVLLNYTHVGAQPAGNYTTPSQLASALAPKANSSDLAPVAFSGDYTDLVNRPTGGGDGEVAVTSVNDKPGPAVVIGLGDLDDVVVPRETRDEQGNVVTPGPAEGSTLAYNAALARWEDTPAGNLDLELLDQRYAPAGYRAPYSVPTLVIQTGDAIPADFPNGGLIFNRTTSTWTYHTAATLKPPTAPTGLAVVAGSTTSTAVGLSWTAVTTTNPAGGPAVTGYAVYQNNVQIKTVTGTGTTMTGLTPSTTYSFKVAAVNADGTGPQSTAVSATTAAATGTVPGAPSNFRTTTTPTTTQVALAWDAPSPGSAPIQGYRIYNNVSQQILAVTAPPILITNLTPGTTYNLTVRAFNSVGEGPASNTITFTMASNPTGSVPGAPSALAAGTPTPFSVSLTWTAGTPDGSNPTQGFRVYRGTSVLQTFASAATSGTLTGLSPATAYTISLKAFNAIGESTASNSVTFTTATEPTGGGPTKRFRVGSWYEAPLQATGTMPVNSQNAQWIASMAAGAPAISFVGGGGQSIANNFWPAILRPKSTDPIYHIFANGRPLAAQFGPGGPGIRIPAVAKQFYSLSSAANDSPMMFYLPASVAPGGRGYYAWAAMLQWDEGGAPVGTDTDRTGRWMLEGVGSNFEGLYFLDSYGMSADPLKAGMVWPSRLTTLSGPGTGVAPSFYQDEPANGGFRGCNAMSRCIDYDRVKAEGIVPYVMEIFMQGSVSNSGRWPMTGMESRGGIVPEGSRIRLKTTINVTSVLTGRLSGAALQEAIAIAKGLQTYGAMIGDSTGSGNHKLKLENTGKEGRGNLWSMPPNAIEVWPINTTNWEFSADGFDPTNRTP